jgi:hypothetical protein
MGLRNYKKNYITINVNLDSQILIFVFPGNILTLVYRAAIICCPPTMIDSKLRDKRNLGESRRQASARRVVQVTKVIEDE